MRQFEKLYCLKLAPYKVDLQSWLTVEQVLWQCVYQVSRSSFCLFVRVRILTAILVQIPSFPRVVYATNNWSSTRPLLTRSRSCSRTFDHFIAHVWVSPWHVSVFDRFGVFCLARCRWNRCMGRTWSVPTVSSIFFSLNKLVCFSRKSLIAPAVLRIYSIIVVNL